MPTNVNEPVWTTGEAVFSGGGAQASVLIPTDLDTVVIDIADATTADVVDVEVSQDAEEAISGINERPLRYAEVAVNDLGGSGELRINAGSALDFTADGWAVGDTFEVLSHRVPDFGPEGTHPTTLGDGEIYTVSSVAAKVLAFTEDPGYSLAEGDIVVAQSRTALADGNVTWFVQGSLDASSDSVTVTLNDMGFKRIRLNQSTGTASVTWSFKGTRQSRRKDAPFVLQVQDRPFAGLPAEKAMLPLASIADGAVVVWDEVVTVGGDNRTRQARATVAGALFESDGVQKFDVVFVGGHSPTGNNGLYTCDSRIADAITFKEPLKGVAGTDTPGRSKWRYSPATLAEGLPSDYEELVLNDMGVSAGSFFKMQDAVISPLTDSGPEGSVDMIAKDPGISIDIPGPWPGSRGIENPAGLEFKDFVGDKTYFGPGLVGAFEGWFRQDTQSGTQNLMLSTDGPRLSTTSATDFIRLLLDGPSEPLATDWAAGTVYASGARVAEPVGSAHIHENEAVGSSSPLIAGLQVVDVGSDKALATATGLANDATVYTATVDVDDDASPQAISIVGSAAQTYTTLITELDADTTDASWSLVDGDLVCTSDTTGELSDIDIVNTDLFDTLTGFVAIDTAVMGDGEPTFATLGNAVTDGADVAAFHDGDFGALLLGATATGLANDATVYHLEVSVDGGGAQLASVTGSTAQTYATLITELDADLTGASWSLKNGELRCTGDSLGDGFTIGITDGGGGGTDMLVTLSDFVSLNTAVISRASVSWRHVVTNRATFHVTAQLDGAFIPPTTGDWFHAVLTRDANGDWRTFFNGVEDTGSRQLIAADDTTPGSFGSPKPFELSVDFAPNAGTGSSGAGFAIGGSGVDGEEQWDGAMAFVAIYEGTTLSPAQILAHYNKGVALGLNT